MGIVRCDVTVSLDGCMAAPGQSLENPMGEGGMRTMAWHDSEADASPFTGTPNPTGAFVMGRNMFGPDRVIGICPGAAGGVRSRHTMPRCMCLVTTRASRCRCRAAPRFTSSPTALRPL